MTGRAASSLHLGKKTKLKTRVPSLLVAAAMTLGAGIALAKNSSGALDPPMVTTAPGMLSPEVPDVVDYSCVSGAIKYAIEALAIYCISGKPMPVFYEFTSTACDASYPGAAAFTVDLSTYTQCDPLAGCPATMNPVAVSYHVKGLAIPKGPQGNPFSSWSPALPDPGFVCSPI
jgi:hypothetical protein